MQRRLLIFLTVTPVFFICFSSSTSQTWKQTKDISNPFDSLSYDKVVAYDYNGSPEMQIVINGQLLPLNGRIYKQKELTKQQIEKLNKTLGVSKSYGGTTAACFDPHFGVVFYRQNKIVGHLSVCLACNYLASTPEIPATKSHKTTVCDECYAYGFSKSGRKNISSLVKELGFSHWHLNSELFDK